MKILQKMLQLDFILRVMSYVHHFLKEKKGNWIDER